MAVVITRVGGPAELAGILELQTANLRRSLSPEEAAREGFVTAEYTPAFMERMHRAEPSVIARDGGRVVGYAIVTTREMRRFHDLLADLCDVIDRSEWRGRPMRELEYVLCGQLCVAQSHRGQGLVPRMYAHFRESLADRYACVVTDVARDNPRSLKAHLRAGFEVFDSLAYGGVEWDLVICDWRAEAAVE